VVTAISHSAVASESPSVAGCALGTATLWCSRFVTGDCDVKFDAAWRGSSSPERDVLSPRPMDVNAIYPNPFNSTTTVILELSEPAPIELTICDPLGRIVRRIEGDILPAGEHRMALNLSDLPSGVYFMRCENSHFPVRRLLLVR